MADPVSCLQSTLGCWTNKMWLMMQFGFVVSSAERPTPFLPFWAPWTLTWQRSSRVLAMRISACSCAAAACFFAAAWDPLHQQPPVTHNPPRSLTVWVSRWILSIPCCKFNSGSCTVCRSASLAGAHLFVHVWSGTCLCSWPYLAPASRTNRLACVCVGSVAQLDYGLRGLHMSAWLFRTRLEDDSAFIYSAITRFPSKRFMVTNI